MNELESYIKKQRISISASLKNSKKIYLDTNYWIRLRDANSAGTERDKELLRLLLNLAKSGKCVLPISEATFWEILKQQDTKTLKASSILIDELSKGISIVSSNERRELEFIVFIRKMQGKEIFELDDLIWTKLPMDVLYNNLPQPQNESLKIGFIEFLCKISFADLVTMIENKGTHVAFGYKDNVDLFNWAKDRYKDQNKSFKQMFLSELGGFIDLFKDLLNNAMKQIYYWDNGRHPNEMETREIDSNILRNMIYNLIRLNKATTEFPSFSIQPELYASIRWNKDRKYVDGNDTIDFLHASAALPYFDYFFTERELATIIKQRKLDEKYSCVVESSQEKIIALLNTM